ncbi:hypothetical protein L1887_61403 [Cichorium endivia]|nr:hypothetical protein L1887_61403 [Cichorium endivia]
MNLHVFLWLSLLLAVFCSSARLLVCTLGAVDAASASWKNAQFLPAVKKKSFQEEFLKFESASPLGLSADLTLLESNFTRPAATLGGSVGLVGAPHFERLRGDHTAAAAREQHPPLSPSCTSTPLRWPSARSPCCVASKQQQQQQQQPHATPASSKAGHPPPLAATMNSLYNQALRQFSSIQSDISRIDSEADTSPTAFGPVTVSLSSLERTIDEYENLAKKELIQSKQEKALTRVAKFRTDYAELSSQLARLKTKGTLSNGASSQSNGSATLRSPTNPNYGGSHANRRVSAIAESPFSLHARNAPASPQADPLAAYKMNASAAAMFGEGGGFSARESHALREHSFIQQTEAQLDAFIAQGREVFGNLVEQRGILKGTQRRLRDAANTLGLSRDVIGYIERRSTQDNIIFALGAIFTLVCFWYIYKWFG